MTRVNQVETIAGEVEVTVVAVEVAEEVAEEVVTVEEVGMVVIVEVETFSCRLSLISIYEIQ